MDLDAKLDELRQQHHQGHLSLVETLMKADGGTIYIWDLLVLAVVQRSLDLLDGFDSMMKSGNYRLAASLIRMQIDSAMRLYSIWLVEKPEAVVTQLLKGEPLARLKARDGEKLRDQYLHKQLSQKYPWVSGAYSVTCEYVHLSRPHMLSIGKPNGDGMDFEIGGRRGLDWAPQCKENLIHAFEQATTGLADLVRAIIEWKKRRPNPPVEGTA
jgi:hypothetical protein